MSLDLSHKVVLVWDASGSYTHICESLVTDFARVLYHVPRDEGFPTSIHGLPGEGLDGIEVVADFFDALEVADLCIFTDVGMGGLQEWLRSNGMAVFGCGSGQRLERDRYFLKSVCKKVGIGIASAVPITGLDNLKEVLSEVDDAWVKLSYWRGDKETFHWKGALPSQSHVDELALKMGPYGALAEFVVEQPIGEGKCAEVGVDNIAIVNGLYPETMLWGYEQKDRAYAGTIARLPERLQATLDKLAPVFKAFNYKGPCSTETRETEDGTYFLDMTTRFPEPPSAAQRFMIANLAEVFYEAAHGRMVEPDFIAPIVVQIVVTSEWGADHPLAVKIGRQDRIAVYGHCIVDGQHYAVSPAEIKECMGAVGLGTTLADAMEDAIDAAESIEGRDIAYDKGALEELTEVIQRGNEIGLNWGGSRIEVAHARA